MQTLPHDLKVIVVPSPYASWSSSLVQSVFCRMLEMRLAGYRAEYGPGVMPIDGSDFVGEQYIICRTRNGDLAPLMGFRSTRYEASRFHGMPFGGIALAQATAEPLHVEALKGILAHCESHSIPLAYLASWTMDPIVREDLGLRRLLKELFLAFVICSHTDSGARIITGGTRRFKVDKWFEEWGFEPLFGADGKVLNSVRVPFLLGEEVQIMYLKRFTHEVKSRAELWRSAWDNRIVLDSTNSMKKVFELSNAKVNDDALV